MNYKKLINNSILSIIFSFLIFSNLYADPIQLLVSPIKYEIEWIKWTTITKTAMLFNRTNETYRILTWKSAFMAWWDTWKPQFIENNPLIPIDQQLPNWISISTDDFIIWPKEKKYITFTIDIPSNASPWWHYWAIFFKNHDVSKADGSSIWIKMDHWLLILINVDWKVITKWEIYDDIKITSEDNLVSIDNCPFIDFTKSNYDWKCIDNILKIILNKINWVEEEEIILWSKFWTWFSSANDFNVSFEIPFLNTWNTHLKPKWEIKLIDEDWNQIKWVWKKVITNEYDIIIWEEIVDFLPINDVWGNVLPNSLRKFVSEWLWFPYKAYDEEWNPILEYWSPSEYYTKKNMKEHWFLMFWEKIIEKQNRKKITSIIDLSYKDREWFDVEFSSAYDFYINYKEDKVWLNFYVIIPAILFILLILFTKTIKWLRKKKCIQCWETVNKKMKLCPYCWNNLKQKDKKKLEE